MSPIRQENGCYPAIQLAAANVIAYQERMRAARAAYERQINPLRQFTLASRAPAVRRPAPVALRRVAEPAPQPAGLFCPKGYYLHCHGGLDCHCIKGARAWRWWSKRPSPLDPNPREPTVGGWLRKHTWEHVGTAKCGGGGCGSSATRPQQRQPAQPSAQERAQKLLRRGTQPSVRGAKLRDLVSGRTRGRR